MTLTFFEKLGESQCILIAGAGGGFDVFAGLPLFFWLRNQGKTVHLANLSFSDLSYSEGDRQSPSLVTVRPDSTGSERYFPERYLAQWLESQGIDQPIYAIERNGARSISTAYQWLETQLQPDTDILIDGGTDIIMRGDEAGLGTRTQGSKLFISPLMAQCWTFDLEGVAARNMYLHRISETQTYSQLMAAIAAFRCDLSKQRTWGEIPY